MNKNQRETPLVSVLMCVYDEPMKYITMAVESVLDQTYKNMEYVVVIDRPDREDVLEYLSKQKKKDIKVIVNKENLGLTRALNKGLSLCRGELVARMDADDISCVERIKDEFEYMCDNNLDIVGCYVQKVDMDNRKIGKITKYPVFSSGCTEYLKARSSLIHPSWLVKRRVYQELNGYRTFDFAEDYDFLLRAAKKYRMACCPTVGLFYRINADGISQKNRIRQKVISRYLRQNINVIDAIQPWDMIEYLKKNQIEQQIIREYFKSMDNIRQMKDSGNITFVFLYLKLLLSSRYAKSSLSEIIRIKGIMLASNFMEKIYIGHNT